MAGVWFSCMYWNHPKVNLLLWHGQDPSCPFGVQLSRCPQTLSPWSSLLCALPGLRHQYQSWPWNCWSLSREASGCDSHTTCIGITTLPGPVSDALQPNLRREGLERCILDKHVRGLLCIVEPGNWEVKKDLHMTHVRILNKVWVLFLLSFCLTFVWDLTQRNSEF